jgi:hypothetical protein
MNEQEWHDKVRSLTVIHQPNDVRVRVNDRPDAHVLPPGTSLTISLNLNVMSHRSVVLLVTGVGAVAFTIARLLP